MTFGIDDYQNSGCGFANKNCTDFVQWRMRHDLGMGCVGWGNAFEWAGRARAAGKVVDGSPQIHDAICLGPHVSGAGGFGHVAMVLGISGGHVWVEDYNWSAPLRYGKHWLPIAGASFIHLVAVAPQPQPQPFPPGSAPWPPGTQHTSFTATVKPMTNSHLRRGPGTNYPIARDVGHGAVLGFDGWIHGEGIPDPQAGGHIDRRWYHVDPQHRQSDPEWIASALVDRDASGSTP